MRLDSRLLAKSFSDGTPSNPSFEALVDALVDAIFGSRSIVVLF